MLFPGVYLTNTNNLIDAFSIVALDAKLSFASVNSTWDAVNNPHVLHVVVRAPLYADGINVVL